MIIRDMPDVQYHSRSELSSTGARALLKSPARFRYDMDHPQPHKAAYDFGTAVHAAVLGVGSSIAVYPEEHLTPSGAVSTKAATREWEEEQRTAGLIPVSQQTADEVHASKEAVLAHPKARMYLEAAPDRELSIFSEIEGVPVRCRFDALTSESRDGRVIGIDLKTTHGTADRDGFTRSIHSWGYHVQAAHYAQTYAASEGRDLDDFVFIVVEKTAPFLVGVHRLDLVWQDMGRKEAAEARRIFAECTKTGIWPGYDTEVQTCAPPAYAVIEHEERYEMEAY